MKISCSRLPGKPVFVSLVQIVWDYIIPVGAWALDRPLFHSWRTCALSGPKRSGHAWDLISRGSLNGIRFSRTASSIKDAKTTYDLDIKDSLSGWGFDKDEVNKLKKDGIIS